MKNLIKKWLDIPTREELYERIDKQVLSKVDRRYNKLRKWPVGCAFLAYAKANELWATRSRCREELQATKTSLAERVAIWHKRITMLNKLIIPVTMVTIPFGISFLDGMFGWELADGFYVLLGLSMTIGLIWQWYIMLTDK